MVFRPRPPAYRLLKNYRLFQRLNTIHEEESFCPNSNIVIFQPDQSREIFSFPPPPSYEEAMAYLATVSKPQQQAPPMFKDIFQQSSSAILTSKSNSSSSPVSVETAITAQPDAVDICKWCHKGKIEPQLNKSAIICLIFFAILTLPYGLTLLICIVFNGKRCNRCKFLQDL